MTTDKTTPSSAGPREQYESAVEAGDLLADPVQARLVEKLQALYDALTRQAVRPRSILESLRGRIQGRNRVAVPGLYIWGGVGRGKTHLVNVFHDCLPFDAKLRIHFHSFMQYVHAELGALAERESPLDLVAEGLARDTRVICFDEFHVSDIADAMILGGLLEALFECGVTLVATSNIAPDDLYKDGLQRSRFLPAIELIKSNTDVVALDSDVDYRLRTLERAEIYHYPLDAHAHEGLRRAFDDLNPENIADGPIIEIAGRDLAAVRGADGIAWFEFGALCETPRSATDYIELARRFHTIMLSGVPQLDDQRRDSALRFVHLIDALYEHNVNLLMSADAPPPRLYTGSRLAQKFARAASRLEEMQTRDYLARGHTP